MLPLQALVAARAGLWPRYIPCPGKCGAQLLRHFHSVQEQNLTSRMEAYAVLVSLLLNEKVKRGEEISRM